MYLVLLRYVYMSNFIVLFKNAESNVFTLSNAWHRRNGQVWPLTLNRFNCDVELTQALHYCLPHPHHLLPEPQMSSSCSIL